MHTRTRSSAALFWYTVAAALLTWPLLTSMTTGFYGVPHDNFGTIWKMWAYHEAFWQGLNFRDVDLRNFPAGVDLFGSLPMYTTDTLNLLFSLVIPHPLAAYNLLLWFKLVLACFFMFKLLTRLSISSITAWSCGLVYGFSPFFLCLTKPYGPSFISAFLPAFILSLYHASRKPSVKSATICVVTGLVFFGENYYYTYFTAVVLSCTAIAYLGVSLIRGDRLLLDWLRTAYTAKRLSLLFVGALIGGVLAAWFYTTYLAPLARTYTSADSASKSARLIFYLLPPIDHAVWGRHLADLYWKIKNPGVDTFELALYLGIVPTALFTYGLVQRQQLSAVQQRICLAVSISFCLSILLALGPQIPLSITGNDTSTTLPGPAWLFNRLAPMLRHNSRYHLLTMFSLTLGMACGATALQASLGAKLSPLKRRAAFLLLAVLCFLEYTNWSRKNVFPLFSVMPQAYKELMRIDGQAPLVQLPSQWVGLRSNYAGYQTFHQHKVHDTPDTYPSVDVMTIAGQERAWRQGFRYVIINTHLPHITSYPLSPHTGDLGLKTFHSRSSFGHLKLLAETDDSLLYSLEQEFQPGGAIFTYASGFFDHRTETQPFAWMSEKAASIKIERRGDAMVLMKGSVRALTPTPYRIVHNGKTVYEGTALPRLTSFAFPLQPFSGQQATVTFRVPGLTSVTSVLDNGDERHVGLFIGAFEAEVRR